MSNSFPRAFSLVSGMEYVGKYSSFKFINPKRKVYCCVLGVSSVGSCVLIIGIK